VDAHHDVIEPDGNGETGHVFVARVVRDLEIALLIGVEKNVVLAVSLLFTRQPLDFY
jgi:hypothetical protein